MSKDTIQNDGKSLDIVKENTNTHPKKLLAEIIKIFIIVLLLIITAGIIYAVYYVKSTGKYNEEKMFVIEDTSVIDVAATESSENPEEDVVDTGLELPDNAVQYDGEFYQYNPDLINLLFIGVDETTEGRHIKNGYITGGHADLLVLVSINTQTEEANIISIPRDCLTEIDIMDSNYTRVINTVEGQICTSYAYGDGKEISANLTTEAVSSLLYSIPINRYFAINLNAIIELTDAVGGITLEVLEDFYPYARYNSIMTKQQEYSMNLHKMKKGNVVTLNGPEACVYVKVRNTKEDNSDLESRRPRQIQFVHAFLDTVKEQTKTNVTLPFELLKLINDYSVYNIENNEFSFLVQTVLSDDFSSKEIISIQGETVVPEGEDEEAVYIVDAKATRELVIDLFYNKISE